MNQLFGALGLSFGRSDLPGSGARRARRWRRAAGVVSAVGALLVTVPAFAVPVGTTVTTPCNTQPVAADSTCSQFGQISSQASLSGLTASARIDSVGLALVTQATVFYYVEVVSSGGASSGLLVPLLIQASGFTDVGGVPPAAGGGFNNNQAHANLRFGGSSVMSACSGFGCSAFDVSSFNGSYLVEVLPSADSGFGPGVFRVQLTADVSTNSNYPTSFAHAFVDPYIQIDPVFRAAHPEYSLAFSANVVNAPLPEPAAGWLLGAGLAGLIGVARRKASRKTLRGLP